MANASVGKRKRGVPVVIMLDMAGPDPELLGFWKSVTVAWTSEEQRCRNQILLGQSPSLSVKILASF